MIQILIVDTMNLCYTKKLPAVNIERSNDYLPHVCKYLQNYWKSIVDELPLHQLDRPTQTISNYGDMIFSTIC